MENEATSIRNVDQNSQYFLCFWREMCFVKSHFSQLWRSVPGAILLVQRPYLRNMEFRWSKRDGPIKMCTEVWCAELLMLRLGHIQCFPLIFLSLAVNPGAGYAWTAVIFTRGRDRGRNMHRLKRWGHNIFVRGLIWARIR